MPRTGDTHDNHRQPETNYKTEISQYWESARARVRVVRVARQLPLERLPPIARRAAAAAAAAHGFMIIVFTNPS